MKLEHTVKGVRNVVASMRAEGSSVGFVPTMGYLHEGHLALIREAKRLADRAVVSIFVNPKQFGPGEDFDTYPRDLNRDLELCRAEKVDAVFAPTGDCLYPDDHSTWINEDRLSLGLCGASRPGHFRGVTTIVAKLFNVVQPDVAFFGQKDAQQALVIKRMVRDLNFPVEIRLVPTVREPDGLALSSRNARLSESQRHQALSLYRGLSAARDLFRSGTRSASVLKHAVIDAIDEAYVTLDYVEVVDLDTLLPLQSVDHHALIAVAGRVGDVRLIDNLLIDA